MRLGSKSARSIPVEVGDKTYVLTSWTRADWKAWGDKLDAQRADQAVRDLSDPVLKARIAAYFPLAPLTLNDLLARVDTTWGTDEMVTMALVKAGMPANQIPALLDNTDHNDLHSLAMGLIGLGDAGATGTEGEQPLPKSSPGSSGEESKH